MIRLGVCTDIRNAEAIAELGYDYVESALNAVARMTEAEFSEAKSHIAASGLACEAMNCMLPADIRVVGPNVQAQQIHDYLDLAFGRAVQLGAKLVVFGSGKSRNVPEGFDYPQAWRQLANYLRMVERHARDHRLIVAVEPLRRAECNIVNFVSEAVALTSLVNMPHVGVLGDTYHMGMGSEPIEALARAGELLCHVHVANPIGRAFPKPKDGEDYARLFRVLEEVGYPGRISIEAKTENLLEDARTSFRLLDDMRRA